MYCTRCGCQTGELDRFCSQCGNLAPGPAASTSPTSFSSSAAMPPQVAFQPAIEPAPLLTRSLRNRKIAGVCGGIGRHFGVDPTIVRILFVVMFFCPVMPAIIPYLVCWFVIPLERPAPLHQPSFVAPNQSFAPVPR